MIKIKKLDCNLVEVTGGEPLFQEKCINLLKELVNYNYEVLLETGGSLSVENVPKEVKKIIDFKCPTSGMENKNLWHIVNNIQLHDAIKFVIGNRLDFDWAKRKISKYKLVDKCTLLMSPSFGIIEPSQIVKWILKDCLPVRMQIQIHKHIWEPEAKGV